MNQEERYFSASEYTQICEGMVAAYWRQHGVPPLLKTNQNMTWIERPTRKLIDVQAPSADEFLRASNEWWLRTNFQPESAVVMFERGSVYIRRRAWADKGDRVGCSTEGAQVIVDAVTSVAMALTMTLTGRALDEIAAEAGVIRKRGEPDAQLRARAAEFVSRHREEDGRESNSQSRALPAHKPSKHNVRRSVHEANDAFAALRDRLR